MNSHNNRMRQLGMTAAFVRAIEADERAAAERATPGFRKFAKQCFEKAQARFLTQMENGAGLPMDACLRAFLLEYNERGWAHGLDSFPSSFNVTEAFFERDDRLAYFRLRREVDHLVSMPKLFDYLTGSAKPSIVHDLTDVTEEGVIYTFNATNPLHELTFHGTVQDEFVVSGVSLVRHGTEVSMIVLTGQITDLATRTEELLAMEAGKITPGREGLRPHEAWVRRAEPLLESPKHWRCLVLLRFDLESETRDAAYIAFDCGDVYRTFTDDLATFDGVPDAFLPNDEIRMLVEQIQKYEPLIEVARACLHLPSMFEELADDIAVERHETEFRRKRQELSRRKFGQLVSAKDRIGYRDVATLADTALSGPDRIGFRSSTMKMDVSGYWKKIPPGVVGQDKRGRDIHGRTWVHRELRWHERSGAVAVATYPSSPAVPGGRNPGSIYIMRSAAHAKDIFKVGLTRRSADERAADLSRTTGSPDHFLVVQEWDVEDCVQAERMAHDRLNEYRLSDRREFFRLPLSQLLRIVGEVVEALRSQHAAS